METTGRLKGVHRLPAGKYIVTFEVDVMTPDAISKLNNHDLDITAKRHRDKRSLDANAYAWVLMQRIAEAVGSDKWSIYLVMLRKYSRVFRHVICKPDAAEEIKRCFRTCEDLGAVKVNGEDGTQLRVYIGSSQFDTKQMSVFLDGVVSEAKELGIETRTPDEIRRMQEQWGI